MKELINFIKEKQKEFNQDSSAYKVLRELEVIIPSMFKDDCQSQKDQAIELLYKSKLQLEYLDKKFPSTGTTAQVLSEIDTYLIETKKD